LKYFVHLREHPPMPLHADLEGEYILLASDGGSAAVVLEFAEVRVGYPSTDLAGLAISVRRTVVVRASLRASSPKSVVTEVVYLARCNTILLLDLRLSGDVENRC
jgi:hypothetical protein